MCSQENHLFGTALIPCYSEFVENAPHHLDKPEPRWQALLAFLAVGCIYLALPRSLIIGPTWLLPTLIVVGPRSAKNAVSLAVVAFFFHKCRSRKASAEGLRAKDGGRVSSIIFSWRLRTVQLSVPPTRRFSPDGQKVSPCCRYSFRSASSCSSSRARSVCFNLLFVFEWETFRNIWNAFAHKSLKRRKSPVGNPQTLS